MPAPLKTEAEKAAAIEGAAALLTKRLRMARPPGFYSVNAQYALLDLCNAVIDMIDDGDCLAQREVLMDELRCDEDGNPVREDGPLTSEERTVLLNSTYMGGN